MPITTNTASLTTSSLHQNPFSVLGVTVRDDRRTIIEQAEHQSLLLDVEECQRARSALTSPKNRITVEMAWLPGVPPEQTQRLLDNLLKNALSARRENTLPSLAHCNLLAAAFDVVNSDFAADELAGLILEFASLIDECDLEDITAQINADRAASGFPAVMGGDIIEHEFRERKRVFSSVVKDALNRLPSESLLKVLDITVRYATNEGRVAAPELINDLLDAYNLEIQSVLEKEDANIQQILDAIRDQITAGEEALIPLINTLERLVKNWDRFARPVQLVAKTRGMDHDRSVQLAWSIRRLALELFNEHDMLDTVTRITNIEREVFADLPEFIEKIAEDEDVLSNFHAERLEDQKKDAEWRQSITFTGSVGRIFKDKLAISPDGIDWDGGHYSLDDISSLRWGAVRNSVNGVPTGTTFTIAFYCERTGGTVITLKDEKTFQGFQAALWRAVGIKLIVNMLKNLDAGERITIGNFVIDDAGVTLLKHKFFGGTEKVRLSWFDVVVSSVNGEFIIRSKADKKTYASASYIEHWDTHIIEFIIRGAFEKGVRNLSDYLKD